MHLANILIMAMSCQKPVIQNIALPTCKDCIHFLPHTSLYANNYELGRCKMYGKKDIISGVITYEYADLVRSNNDKCGRNGINYEASDKSNSKKI